MTTETKLKRIAWLSQQNSDKKFDSLMHYFNKESLIGCFIELDEKKAHGIDGVSKKEYAKSLYDNIDDLLQRMKNMAYRPGPVREVLIPKDGKPGTKRPLGISNLEDKIVQRMMQKVLESVYEPIFLECSHGFRPGKNCHTAIQALQKYLYNNTIQTVIDIDLKNFFGSIDHEKLKDILRIKINDTKLLRYISRMFKAGVLAEGELKISAEGVPQGSICSPILANIFAHYALDIWIEQEVKRACKGKVALFRYADDAIICCQLASDAIRVKQALVKRLEKFKLKLNEEKTKLVSFDKRAAARGVEQGTFEFLGFTFYLGKSRSGWVIPKLKTRSKTKRNKLRKVAEWAKRARNMPLGLVWKMLTAKLRGHIQYYGVSHNYEQVKYFLYETTRIMFKWLNRRSQRKSFTWEQFSLYIKRNPLPKVKIAHQLF